MEASTHMPCRKCSAEAGAHYCPQCGHPVRVARIDRSYILQEIVRVLNFDQGILFTVRELLLRPGTSIRAFLDYDRTRLVKPMLFLLVCSLMYTLAQQVLRFEDGYVRSGGFGDSAVTAIMQWVQGNYGYANLIMALFTAGWIKVLFRKYDYNLFEILILLCFVMGIGMLIYTVAGILESLTGLRLLQAGGMVAFGYCAWAIGQFYDGKKWHYAKGLLAYLLGMITCFLGAILLGIGIDRIGMG